MITLNEYSNALRDMPNNKAPGTDGLPTEFFFKDISKNLLDSFNFSFSNGCLPIKEGELLVLFRSQIKILLLKKKLETGLTFEY